MTTSDVLVVAGEASGDLHAARLLDELKTRLPPLRTFGLGGPEMAEAGCDLLADSAEISVVGITEVLKILPRAREIFAQLLAEVDRRGTRFAILVDFPDFNLRLAKKLRARGVSVIYYISPQVWAWRKGRVKQIARDIDLMMVLFPFEVDFYRQHGVRAVHVGHPLVDEVPTFEPPALKSGDVRRIALLPGSRGSEVRALLATLLRSVSLLASKRPDQRFEALLIQAPSVAQQVFDPILTHVEQPSNLRLTVVHKERFRAIASAELALCASGTATLEVGLIGTPLVVLYRLNRWSYLLGRLLVDLPHFSLVNLVMNRDVVPELLQGEAEPENVSKVAGALLDEPDRMKRIRQDLSELRQALGEGGASGRAAEHVVAHLQTKSAVGGISA